ncbi:hypothetical protein CYMTET_14440 [Cymbomonas tetramitiformis]|uniref:HECT-type E3 ubiquitin transferase n=1 Tax=Cymbomonas tetramitiformis TaxID=36881 RepID=A0AAE0L9X3_9CHLO|nr:hypothetical protein CYMTET_14440 [Cymbomonas tetramitiformis]
MFGSCLGCFTGRTTVEVLGLPTSTSSPRRNAELENLPSDSLASQLLSKSKQGGSAVLAMGKSSAKPQRSQWISGTDVHVFRARGRAICTCVDAVLDPLLDVVDAHFDSTKHRGDDEQALTWQDVQVEHISHHINKAATSLYKTGDFRPVAEVLNNLLEVLHDVWHAALKPPAMAGLSLACFQSNALNRLMGMLSVVFCRRVTLESASALQYRAAQLTGLFNALGLRDRYLAPALSPSSKALMLYMETSKEGECKTSFQVRRAHAFWDAVEQAEDSLMRRDPSRPLCSKVFPTFVQDTWSTPSVGNRYAAGVVELEQGEGHGPRKEFFSLSADSACSGSASVTASIPPSPPALFHFNRASGKFWFNLVSARSEKMDRGYRFFGWLIGQAINNRCTLGIGLPEVLFRKLLEGPNFCPTMQMLQDFDPESAKSLDNIRGLSEREFHGLLEMEGCQGLSRKEYINKSIADLLSDGVQWQMEALEEGFVACVERQLFRTWAVTPRCLMDMVCGTDQEESFNIREVFRIALDEELSTTSSELADSLWRVLDFWPIDMKRKFVQFVTGSDRLPLKGTELLRIEVPFVAVSQRDHQRHLGMLPQAHTCENVLELPNYWEAQASVEQMDVEDLSAEDLASLRTKVYRLLEERLRLAVTQCDSYGLDELTLNTPDVQILSKPGSRSWSSPNGDSKNIITGAAQQHQPSRTPSSSHQYSSLTNASPSWPVHSATSTPNPRMSASSLAVLEGTSKQASADLSPKAKPHDLEPLPGIKGKPVGRLEAIADPRAPRKSQKEAARFDEDSLNLSEEVDSLLAHPLQPSNHHKRSSYFPQKSPGSNRGARARTGSSGGSGSQNGVPPSLDEMIAELSLD